MVRVKGAGARMGGEGTSQGKNSTAQNTERARRKELEKRLRQMKKRTIHPERGIDLDHLAGTFVTETIDALGWRSLAEDPGDYNPRIVQEFYAAMIKDEFHIDGKVRVQGHEVVMTAARINAHFGLENYGFLSGIPPREEFESKSRLGSILRMDGSDLWDSTRTLKQGQLGMEAAFWNCFRSYSIRATLHYSELTEMDGQIAFCIENHLNIDVGMIIKLRMEEVCDDMNAILPYPSLISHFCNEAGLDVFSNRSQLQRQGPLSRQGYNNMAGKRGVPQLESSYVTRRTRAHGRQAAAAPPFDEVEDEYDRDGHDPDVVPPAPESAQSRPAWVTEILDGQRALFDGQRELVAEQRALARRIGAIERRLGIPPSEDDADV